MSATSTDAEETKQSGDEDGNDHPVLDTVKEVVGQAGQESLPLIVGPILDALFSEPVRQRVLQQTEEGLQEILESGIDALPGSGDARGMERELARAKRQLRTLLRETVDTLSTGSARAELQQELEQAVRELMEGDTEAAKHRAELAGESALSGVADVLRDHAGQILGVLIGVIAKALQAALTSQIKDAFAGITALPAEEIEEKTEPLQEKFAEKAEELRQRLEETRDTMEDRLAEAKEQIQERIGGGAAAAVKGGSSSQSRFGQPPSRRPPPGPTDRFKPGRPPNGRPPPGPGSSSHNASQKSLPSQCSSPRH